MCMCVYSYVYIDRDGEIHTAPTAPFTTWIEAGEASDPGPSHCRSAAQVARCHGYWEHVLEMVSIADFCPVVLSIHGLERCHRSIVPINVPIKWEGTQP